MQANRKCSTSNIFSGNGGMAIIEFMLTIMLCLLFVGSLIELGFYLKSEAVVVGLTKNLARQIQVGGGLTISQANEIINKLEENDIEDAKITVRVFQHGGAIIGNYEFTKNGGTTANVPFRRDFKVYLSGKHGLKSSKGSLSATVIFAEDGKGENAKDFLN